MSLVRLSYGMTLNTGQFNNFKPDIELTIDTDKDIDEQIQAGRAAINRLAPALSEEMVNILETEGLTGYESLLIKQAAEIKNLKERLRGLEKVWTQQEKEQEKIDKPKPKRTKSSS